MGCGNSNPVPRVSVEVNFRLTNEINFLDDYYTEAAKALQDLNRIGAGLLVSIDKFKTVTGLHNPPRKISFGLISLIVSVLVDCGNKPLAINLSICDSFPGLKFEENSVSDVVRQVYTLWVGLAGEIEASLEDFEIILTQVLKIADKTTKLDSAISKEVKQQNYRSSTIKLIQEIRTENSVKIIQAADFFHELVSIVKTEGVQITQLLEKLSEPKNLKKLTKMAKQAIKDDLAHPVEITDLLSPQIERLFSQLSLE